MAITKIAIRIQTEIPEFRMSSSFFCCDLAKYACGLLTIVVTVGIVIGCGEAPVAENTAESATPDYNTAVMLSLIHI